MQYTDEERLALEAISLGYDINKTLEQYRNSLVTANTLCEIQRIINFRLEKFKENTEIDFKAEISEEYGILEVKIDKPYNFILKKCREESERLLINNYECGTEEQSSP